MRRKPFLILALALILFAPPLISRLFAERRTVRYAIRPVGLNLGWGSYAVDINNAGQVLGNADGVWPGGAVFVDRAGKRTTVPVPGNAIRGTDINNRGDVLAWNRVPDMHMYLWRAGRLTEIRPNGIPRSVPMDIGDDGKICATVVPRGASVPIRYYVWRNGAVTPLGFRPSAIAPDGSVAGTQESSVGGRFIPRPCVWKAGSVTNLAVPAVAFGGGAYGANGRGQVVGSYYSTRGQFRSYACLWSNGQFNNLGDLGSDSVAMAINDRSQAVGYGEVRGSPIFYWRAFPRFSSMVHFEWPHHAALFEGSKAYDLNRLIPADPDWLLEEANAINDHGVIVGNGTYKGQKRGFVLTPIR